MAAATNIHPHQNSAQVAILVGGSVFKGESYFSPQSEAQLQGALNRGREQYGHAYCLCRTPNLKLQIRQRNGKFHLAVWPDQGALHDSNCVFFRDEGDSSRSEFAESYQPTRGKQDQDEVELSVHFSFDSRSKRNLDLRKRESLPNIQNYARIEKSKQPIGLHGLANILWEEASLNRWHPAWSRDWPRTRYQLLQAASRIKIAGEALAEHIFIPRPFRPDDAQALNQEIRDFMDSVSESRSGILIAPIRQYKDKVGGAAELHLRHMLSPVHISKETLEGLDWATVATIRTLRRQSTLDERTIKAKATTPPANWVDIKKPEYVAVLRVSYTSRLGFYCRAAHFVPVHPQLFIPAGSSDEVKLIDKLIEQEHQFTRILSTEPTMRRNKFDWLIRHVIGPDGSRVPNAMLELRDGGAPTDLIEKRTEMSRQLAELGLPVWVWHLQTRAVDRIVPELPPTERLDRAQIWRSLNLIKANPHVTYSYGPTKRKPTSQE